MGTRVAPSYANLFMKYLEIDLLEPYNKKPKFWLRFIDDLFIIWPHGEEELEKFNTFINSHHPTIKFTIT